MDMDQVQRKDINNLMNESLSKELDVHIGEYDSENNEYVLNINPFNYATVECNNWIMDFDELSKSYVPSEDSIIFLFNDKVKLNELSLKYITEVVFSFTAENCIVESIGFGGSVIDFIEVNSEGDVSVSLDLSKYSVNELVKLFSDDLFSIVVVLSNDLNRSDSVLNDWNLQFIFKDLLLDEKEATKNRIEEFTESTYLKKSDEYSIIDVVYPVGSIYMSVNTSNPSTLFPNTIWEKIEDRFLLSSGSTYSSGSTGGSKDAVVVKHNHTQNAHHHSTDSGYSYLVSDVNVAINGTKRSFPSTGTSANFVYSSNGGSINEKTNTANTTATNNETGVSGTDKNMPPYLVVNIWKRIQ